MRDRLGVVLVCLILTACGSGGGSAYSQSTKDRVNPESVESSTVTPPYVYSTASLNGIYSVVLGGELNGQFNLIGSFKADGKGRISAGTLLQNGFNPNPYPLTVAEECTVTFSGTYSIKSSASGVMIITFKVPTTSVCAVEDSGVENYRDGGVFYLQLGQQGSTVLLGSYTGHLSGTAIRQ